MDLTQGISQMQSQLKPDMFGAASAGATSYGNMVKTGQEIATNRIKNEQAEQQKQIEFRLQRAITESINPATGQPDYDKLSQLGQRYGIDAQTMAFARKHIEDNWAAFANTAMNKQQTQNIVTPSSYNNANAATVPDSTSTWSTQKPTAPVKQETAPVESTTLGVAPVNKQEQVADQPGASTTVDQGKQMDLGSTNLSTFTLPAPTDAPAPAPTDPLALKPGEAPKAPSTNFYSLMNQADVQNPFGAQAGGAGGSMSSGLFARETAPQNTKGVNETLNPSEDLAGNTKLFLAGNGYNSGDYNADYNAALDAASDAVMAKMPSFPLSTGNFAKDQEARNAYRNEVNKVRGEAIAARNALKKDINDGNFKRADATLKDLASTITIEGTKFRANDAPAKAVALSLVPIKTEIPTFMADLGKVKDNDRAALGMMVARGARLYASAMNPGAQVSEGSLEEVGRQVLGEHANAKDFAIGGAAAFKAGGMQGLGEYLGGMMEKYDGASIKNRLKDMSHGAEQAIEKTLAASLVGYKAKDPQSRKDFQPEATTTSDTPILKTGWYDRKPGEKLFESNSGKQYKVTARDALGYPSEAIDRNNDKYSLTETPAGIVLEQKGWAAEKPSAKGKGKAKETAAERFKRLTGGK